MEEIYRSRFLVVQREPGTNIIFTKRTSTAVTAADFEHDMDELIRLIPLDTRADLLHLHDAREAPLVPNDELEQVLNTVVAAKLSGFKRRAVIVQTAVGRLQAARMSRSRGDPMRIFNDEASALDYLQNDKEPRSEQ